MAKERFGDLSSDDLKNLRSDLNEFADTVASTSSQINRLSQDAVDNLGKNFNKSKNAISSIAKLTADQLKTTKGQQTLEREIQKIKSDQLQSETNLLILKKKLEVASKDEVEELGKALRLETDRSAALAESVKSAGQLASEVEKINKAGEGFKKMGDFIKKIPLLGKLGAYFDVASEAAKKAASEGAGRFKSTVVGALTAIKKFTFFVGVSVVKALIEASSRFGEINKQLGLGVEAARETAQRFEDIALNANDTRINTDKLIKANADLNSALGTSVEFSGETLKNFILTTEYMGISVESAAKLETLARITGENTKDFAGNLAESVSEAGRANGIFLSTSTALEKVKNLSATTLINLRNSPKAIGEAIVETEKLGLSFDKLRGIASSLLDFESSIQKELEAELLTGRELNLERARAAALRGDDLALTRELSKQVGTLTEFQNMNIIQRESLAQAFGLSSDAMSEMLLKQELMNSLGEQANDLSAEQAARIKEMVDSGEADSTQDALLRLQQEQDVTKRFQDILQKLKSTFVDIVQKYEKPISDFIKKIEDFFESGKFSETITKVKNIISEALDILKPVAKALASKGGIAAVLGLMLANRLRGATPLTPMFVAMSGMGGMGGTGTAGAGMAGLGGAFYQRAQPGMSWNQYQQANAGKGLTSSQMSAGYHAQKGGTPGGLTAAGGMGLGMIASIGGGMLKSYGDANDSAAASIGGSALSMAGTGAMIGSMFAPGIGTAIGAGVGALAGLFMGHLEQQEKEAQRKREEAEQKEAERQAALQEIEAGRKTEYEKMEEHLRKLAEKQADVYLDSNQVNIGLRMGEYKMG